MIPIILAQTPVETDQLLSSWRFMDSATRGILLIWGSIGIVTALALVWVVFFRKRGRRRRKRRHEHHHSSKPDAVPEVLKEEVPPSPPEKRRHRRRSGRHHRPRNPTLAETGGLPPIRPEGPSEPSA